MEEKMLCNLVLSVGWDPPWKHYYRHLTEAQRREATNAPPRKGDRPRGASACPRWYRVLVGGGSGSAGSLSGRSLSRPLGVAEASRAPLEWPQHVLDRALSHPLGQAPVCPSAQRGKQGRGYHAHFTGEETEPGEWKRLAEISPN